MPGIKPAGDDPGPPDWHAKPVPAKAASLPELSEDTLAGTWLEQFNRWHQVVLSADLAEPYAMVVATATPEGRPGVRTVLLRGVAESGFVFHTNHNSRKGRELSANPRASLLFAWYDLNRQVIVDGMVQKLNPAESDAYWDSRPFGSRLSAMASPQSQVVDSRSVLEDRHASLESLYRPDQPLPRPAHWGGFLVVPDSVEFWQGRPNRLHDRLRFRREDDDWIVERLAP